MIEVSKLTPNTSTLSVRQAFDLIADLRRAIDEATEHQLQWPITLCAKYAKFVIYVQPGEALA